MEARGQVVGAEMERVRDRQPYTYSYTSRYACPHAQDLAALKKEQNSDMNIFPSSLFLYAHTEPLLFYFTWNDNTSESNPDFAILISSVLGVFS